MKQSIEKSGTYYFKIKLSQFFDKLVKELQKIWFGSTRES